MNKCHKCGETFTETGLKLHTDSKRCKRLQNRNNLKIQTREAYDEIYSRDKRIIPRVVYNALMRRGLEDLTGIEEANSKYIEAWVPLFSEDDSCRNEKNSSWQEAAVSQCWAYAWVELIWKHFNVRNDTNEFYTIMEHLDTLPDVDRQKQIAVLELQCIHAKI